MVPERRRTFCEKNVYSNLTKKKQVIHIISANVGIFLHTHKHTFETFYLILNFLTYNMKNTDTREMLLNNLIHWWKIRWWHYKSLSGLTQLQQTKNVTKYCYMLVVGTLIIILKRNIKIFLLCFAFRLLYDYCQLWVFVWVENRAVSLLILIQF